jgi:hypothetical protein
VETALIPDEVAEVVSGNRELGQRQAAGGDLLDTPANAIRFGMGEEPGFDSARSRLAVDHHGGDKAPFRRRDLVDGAIDRQPFELIAGGNVT